MGDLLDLGVTSTWLSALQALLGAFVFGQILAWAYELTFRGVSYSRAFGQSIVLAGVAAATVVLAMAHSLVAGLGLLGVLSMIRFRTTLKSPRDLVFVMASAASGIAVGVGALGVALAGTVGFAAIALYLHLSPLGSRARFDGVLRFRVPSTAVVEPRLSELLDEHCRRRTLLSVAEVAQGQRVEHAYEVQLFGDRDREALLTALRKELEAADARLLLQDAAVEY